MELLPLNLAGVEAHHHSPLTIFARAVAGLHRDVGKGARSSPLGARRRCRRPAFASCCYAISLIAGVHRRSRSRVVVTTAAATSRRTVHGTPPKLSAEPLRYPLLLRTGNSDGRRWTVGSHRLGSTSSLAASTRRCHHRRARDHHGSVLSSPWSREAAAGVVAAARRSPEKVVVAAGSLPLVSTPEACRCCRRSSGEGDETEKIDTQRSFSWLLHTLPSQYGNSYFLSHTRARELGRRRWELAVAAGDRPSQVAATPLVSLPESIVDHVHKSLSPLQLPRRGDRYMARRLSSPPSRSATPCFFKRGTATEGGGPSARTALALLRRLLVQRGGVAVDEPETTTDQFCHHLGRERVKAAAAGVVAAARRSPEKVVVAAGSLPLVSTPETCRCCRRPSGEGDETEKIDTQRSFSWLLHTLPSQYGNSYFLSHTKAVSPYRGYPLRLDSGSRAAKANPDATDSEYSFV
nr:hypothetical protein Iba_chr02eCG6750 [Ipomoea batatas]